MKKEIISDALDALDDEFIAHAAESRAGGHRKSREEQTHQSPNFVRERLRRAHALRTYDMVWMGVGAAAACFLVLAFLVSPQIFGHKDAAEPQRDPLISGSKDTVEPQKDPVISDKTEEKEEPVAEDDFVQIASLLGENDGLAISQLGQRMTSVPVGSYSGVYEGVESARKELLPQSVGAPVPGADGWYHVMGHEDMQYLISRDAEDLALWKFLCFDSEEYPYRDVLELVYRVDCADRIVSLTVKPPRFDNTDRGKQIQQKIGTHTIEDRAMIETLYEILSSLSCYGKNHWELIDYGAEDADEKSGTRSGDGMRLGRYLTIATAYGNEIDGLKYTAVSNQFYEFSGIAYARLAEEQAERVWDIIGITED